MDWSKYVTPSHMEMPPVYIYIYIYMYIYRERFFGCRMAPSNTKSWLRYWFSDIMISMPTQPGYRCCKRVRCCRSFFSRCTIYLISAHYKLLPISNLNRRTNILKSLNRHLNIILINYSQVIDPYIILRKHHKFSKQNGRQVNK